MIDIATARRARGMTQGQLARKLGVRQTSVSQWECGIWLPRPMHVKAMAEILEVDALELSASFSKAKKTTTAA